MKTLDWRTSIHQHITRPLLSRFGWVKSKPPSTQDLEILLRRLHPVETQCPLLRLGPDHDGGYLVPDDLHDIVACFSPGVGHVSGFEDDCARRGIPVFMADASVNDPSMTRTSFHLVRKMIGLSDSAETIRLDTWIDLANIPRQGDLLLQMDIEGDEWLALATISPANLRRFRIIVVECHTFDLLLDSAGFQIRAPVLNRLLDDFWCIHLHPNNSTGSRRRLGFDLPRTVELTLLRKDRTKISGFRTDFPHRLDRDNTSNGHLRLSPSLYRTS